MDFEKLDKNQLKTLFLKINAQYLKFIEAPIDTYIQSPEFLKLRKELHEVMSELDKRRMIDPPIMHENSPRGLEPDSFYGTTTFTAE